MQNSPFLPHWGPKASPALNAPIHRRMARLSGPEWYTGMVDPSKESPILVLTGLDVPRLTWLKTVADLGGPAGSAPPPLGDGLTPSLTVTLANAKFWSFYCKTWYSKYWNDCHQWLSDSFRVFGRGSAYSAPPDPLAGKRGPISKGRQRGKGREEGERKEIWGTGPPFANSWIRPWTTPPTN